MKRITITIPEELLDAADSRAALLRRSRSWVISEAIRDQTVSAGDRTSVAVRESANLEYNASRPGGLGESRRAQLTADMALTPSQRVIEAERTLMRAGRRGPSLQNRVITFDRFEDFLEWDRLDQLRT
jgi:hypothetical protein